MAEMSKRLELDSKFREILGSDNVYFQPPESMKINYPCIIYFKTSVPSRYANDMIYKYDQSYTVTVIDKDPDSEIPFTLMKSFQYCKLDNFYRTDNLNHTKLTLFY